MFSARRRRKKIKVLIVATVGDSSWYTFLKSVLCFQPAAGGEKFQALIVAAVGDSNWYTFFESLLCIWPAAGGNKFQALKACYVFGPP